MPIQLILDGKDGADAAKQLLDFVSVISGATPIAMTRESAEAANAAAAAPVDKPAAQAVSSADTPAADGDKTVDEKPTRRTRRTEPKAEEKAADPAPAAEPKAEPAATQPEATAEEKKPEFAAPPGFNEKVQTDAPAAPEVIEAAKAMVEKFKPAEGEPATLDYCRTLLLLLAASKGLDHNRKVLDGFGVKKVQEIPFERFGEFAAKVYEVLNA